MLENTINKNLKRAQKLRRSILNQVFEGKLVLQDPNDEPASVLLDRIKVEKAKRETEEKVKRKRTTREKASSPQLDIFQDLAEKSKL